MLSYGDKTWCTGAGCQAFATCPRALTPEVRAKAQAWWRGPNPPFSQLADPTKLKCYVPRNPPPPAP